MSLSPQGIVRLERVEAFIHSLTLGSFVAKATYEGTSVLDRRSHADVNALIERIAKLEATTARIVRVLKKLICKPGNVPHPQIASSVTGGREQSVTTDETTRLLLTMMVYEANTLEDLISKYRDSTKEIKAWLSRETPLDEADATGLTTALSEASDSLNAIGIRALGVATGAGWAAELVAVPVEVN